MSKEISIEVRCLHCEKWFKSPIGFGGVKSYDTSNLIGISVNCSHCGKITDCNKENIRFVERNKETGEVHYIEGQDTYP